MGTQFNSNDLKRIEQKLAKLTNINAPGGLVFNYRLKILNEYVEVTTDLMGRISADGGIASLNFLDETASAYWSPLSNMTNVKKQRISHWSAEIWEASGTVKRAVLKSLDASKYTFAGIYRDAEALRHAKTAEELRPLFSMVNEIFHNNKARIVHEITNLIKHELAWGAQ